MSHILPRVLHHIDSTVKASNSQPLDWINKEVLYQCLREILRGSDPGLDVNYYEVHPAILLSVWVEEPGFEVIIVGGELIHPLTSSLWPWAANPVDVPELREYYENLPQLVESSTIDIQEPLQENSSRCRSDPFDMLPCEMLLEVFSYLTIDSIDAIQSVSHAGGSSLSNETWRRRIKSDMPWLWDLFEDEAHGRTVCKTAVDWEKVYMFFERCSRFEACDYICGLINRRRI